MNSIIFPLQPLAEQQLIVAEIEKIFAQIDLLEQNKTDLQTAIKQAKSKILDLAIYGKLIPQDTNDEHESNLKRSKLEEGDLLISIAGTLGKVGFVKKSDLPMNTNQAIAFVRLQKNIFNNMFLKYSIESPSINSNLLSKTKATSIPNLTLEMISDCLIPLPSLAEQQRIVSKIEEIFAILDRISNELGTDI
ncbi:MAG: restriction endonuclease subunit S [Treponema sp.]|nr:restriction endonuclease subunit S [Treponema sp.]MBP3607756.1 restriction endonuclease subunit S [Treponema sp.]